MLLLLCLIALIINLFSQIIRKEAGLMALIKSLISIITAFLFSLSLMPGPQITENITGNDTPGFKSFEPELLTASPAVSEVYAASFGSTALDRVTGSDSRSGVTFVCGVSNKADGNFVGAGSLRYPFGFVAKFDTSGNILNVAFYSDSSLAVHVSDVCALRNGGAVICGYTYSSGNQNVKTTAFAAAYNSNLELVWQTSLEGSNNVEFNSISATANGFVAGGKTNSVDGDFAGTDFYGASGAFLMRYKLTDNAETGETEGTLMWKKTFFGEGASEVTEVSVDGSNNIFVCISTDSVSGSYAGFDGLINGSLDNVLLKYNGIGVLQWYYVLASAGRDNFNFVGADSSGGCIVGGYTFRNGAIAGSNLGGTLDGITASGGTDSFVFRFSADGKLSWHRSVSGAGDDFITSVAKVGSNFVAGGYSDSRTREFSSNYGGFDGFADVISSDGSRQVQMINFGGSENDRVNAMSVTNGYLFIGGISASTDGWFDGKCQYASVQSGAAGSQDISDCFVAIYN